MIVIHQKNNLVTLPYIINGKVSTFDFLPGRNQIEAKVFDAIKIYNKKRFENHYQFILKPFSPPGAIKKNDIGDEEIIIFKLDAPSFVDLISNTNEIKLLKDYIKSEEKRDRPRNTILKAIKEKINDIKKFEKKLLGDKDKK